MVRSNLGSSRCRKEIQNAIFTSIVPHYLQHTDRRRRNESDASVYCRGKKIELIRSSLIARWLNLNCILFSSVQWHWTSVEESNLSSFSICSMMMMMINSSFDLHEDWYEQRHNPNLFCLINVHQKDQWLVMGKKKSHSYSVAFIEMLYMNTDTRWEKGWINWREIWIWMTNRSKEYQ